MFLRIPGPRGEAEYNKWYSLINTYLAAGGEWGVCGGVEKVGILGMALHVGEPPRGRHSREVDFTFLVKGSSMGPCSLFVTRHSSPHQRSGGLFFLLLFPHQERACKPAARRTRKPTTPVITTVGTPTPDDLLIIPEPLLLLANSIIKPSTIQKNRGKTHV